MKGLRRLESAEKAYGDGRGLMRPTETGTASGIVNEEV
jgi:hypothetical protein